MVRVGNVHSNRSALTWYILPICLCLIFLGIRVPDLTHPHSSPKPSPRAVIETASKSNKIAIAKQVFALELPHGTPELTVPMLSPLRFLPVTCQVASIAPPQISARAPPVFAS